MELRKRKAATEPARPASAPKKPRQKTDAKDKTDGSNAVEVKGQQAAGSNNKPVVGDSIELDGFGGEIQTQDGATVTLKSLLDDSKSGVVLFTYPRASTPGCTKQACLFRDGYKELSSTGLSILGLSADSTKANTGFQSKQNLPYPLLCDQTSSLITAIGFKKNPKGTIRGVFAIDKSGKVLVCEAGSPANTFDVIEKLVKK